MNTIPLRNVFFKTLFDYRRAIFGWSLGIFLLVLMYASIYPSIAKDQAFDELLQNLPEAFRALVGEAGFFSTPAGYINGEFFSLTFPLIIGILSIIIGGGTISKEEESGTIELLLSRPVSRASLLLQKASGMMVVSALITLAGWLGILAGRLVVSEFAVDLWRAFCATFMVLLMGWFFGIFALLVAVIKGRAMAAGVAGVLFIASYVVSTFAASAEWLHGVRWLSLFQYFKTDQVFLHGINYRHVALWLVLVAVCCLAARWAFDRRDLNV